MAYVVKGEQKDTSLDGILSNIISEWYIMT